MLMYYGCDQAGQLGERGSLKRQGWESAMVIPRFQDCSPPPVSVKDRTILVPMTRFELCTDHMSDFMGPDKSSSFCNYYVEPHLPTLCGAFTFGGRMKPRAKTSS
jgi:hypothetical protein